MLSRSRVFWAVSFGHLTIDMFNGMVSVVMAFLSAHILSLNNGQIGFAIGAYQLAGSISQPFFGWYGDRKGGRWLGAGGVAWTVAFLLIALLVAQTTRQFGLMLIPFVLASFGSAAFHPVGAMYAASAEKGRAASSTSWFFLFGQIGLGLGPVLAGLLLDSTLPPGTVSRAVSESGPDGLGAVTPLLALGVFALPAVLYMASSLPTTGSAATPAASAGKAGRAGGASFPMQALLFFALVVTLRSLANPGTVAFIPRLFQAKGWDAAAYGLITSLFWVGSGITGVLFGMLADRFQNRHIIAVSLLLAAPMFFLLPLLDGGLALIMALLAGALSGGSHSLLVVQAQSLLPGRQGFASGAILGFIFATGALGSVVIGALSDAFSLSTAFQIVAAVTVVAAFMGLALPDSPRRHAAPVVQEQAAD